MITESFLRSGQVQLSTLSLREFIAMALLAHHCKARRAGFLQTVGVRLFYSRHTRRYSGARDHPLWTMKTSSLPGTPGKETIRHVCLGVLRTSLLMDRYTPSSCVTVLMLGKKGETTSQQSDDIIFPSRHKVSPVFAQAVYCEISMEFYFRRTQRGDPSMLSLGHS